LDQVLSTLAPRRFSLPQVRPRTLALFCAFSLALGFISSSVAQTPEVRTGIYRGQPVI
jgi:hypothetical protein